MFIMWLMWLVVRFLFRVLIMGMLFVMVVLNWIMLFDVLVVRVRF